MADEFAEGFAEALGELLDVTESVVTWNGQDIPVLPSSAVRGKDLSAGGFRLRADLKFVARVGDLPTPGPALKQTLTFDGDRYRIDTMEYLPGGTLIRFECNDPNQGA